MAMCSRTKKPIISKRNNSSENYTSTVIDEKEERRSKIFDVTEAHITGKVLADVKNKKYLPIRQNPIIKTFPKIISERSEPCGHKFKRVVHKSAITYPEVKKPTENRIKRKRFTPRCTRKIKNRSLRIPIPIPVKLPESDSEWEDIGLTLPTTNRVGLPVGVRDVDSRAKDSLSCKEYVQEIINYMRILQFRYVCSPTYLDKEKQITPVMRAKLLDWLLQVQHHLALSTETLYMCVGFLDRFLQINKIGLMQLQLTGITCLLIASKLVDKVPLEIDCLVHLTDNSFKREEVIHMEQTILKALQYELSMSTPIFFLDRFRQVADHSDKRIDFLSSYLMDLILPDIQTLKYLPSVYAASGIYLARLIMLKDELNAWDLTLQYYTCCTTNQMRDCIKAMAKALSEVKSSKLQGAHKKYSSKSIYQGISVNLKLAKSSVIRRLTCEPI